MNNIKYLLILAFLAHACSSEPELEDILSNLSFNTTTLLADGSSSAIVSVELPLESSSDRRSVKFDISNGAFSDGSKSKVVKATFEEGILLSKIGFSSTTKPGSIIISVQPEFDSPLRDYIIRDSIISTVSTPAKIELNPSSFGIMPNYLSEVVLLGKIVNSNNKDVSEGYEVIFEDFLSDGSIAGGRFRNITSTTSDSSDIRAIYGARSHPIGTDITILVSLLAPDGTKSQLNQAVTLTTNQ